MTEKTSPVPTQTTPSPEATAPELAVPETRESNESNESFLGTILIVVLVLLLVGVTGFFGFVGYRAWRENQVVKSTPSIERIAVEEPAPTAEAPSPGAPSTATPESTPAVATPTIDKVTLEIKVLNGGAAKGSAGTLTETLKKTGFTKATYGNATGDYAGTVIYYAEGKEKEAEALKVDVMKIYPGVTTAKSIASNKDSTVASLVVILGK